MKTVIQRVSGAEVKINGITSGKCGNGFLIFLGIMKGDTTDKADKMADKIANLRVFEDENGKMNLSSLDIGAEILVVSQFTLCADCSHGRRPSFARSSPPDEAKPLYEYFVNQLRKFDKLQIETGVFGADMQVSLLNNGPVTIILDSEDF
ncbi:MAG: D-tyrosyl-tRNA(Tyr) deacylase [Clostridiales bacterium]|nr:D-tyrosyl-tRNA(Tyr) deacylase [Clostridiales bacterium]MCD7871733.1 D-tyrosyl-tRNA(Tyr) deacylase [Clostridiales bacterium]